MKEINYEDYKKLPNGTAFGWCCGNQIKWVFAKISNTENICISGWHGYDKNGNCNALSDDAGRIDNTIIEDCNYGSIKTLAKWIEDKFKVEE